LLALGGAAIALALPATASAAQRFASPTGTGSNPCSNSMDPCPITTAINMASSGDEVILGPGDYGSLGSPISTALSAQGVSVHATPGARARIFGNQPKVLEVKTLSTDPASLSDVEVVHVPDMTGGEIALFLNGFFGPVSANRVVARSESTDGFACTTFPVGSATFSNGVCASSGGPAMVFSASSASGTDTINLRNLTLRTTSSSAADAAPLNLTADSGISVTADVRNTIIKDSDGTKDILLSATNGSHVSLTLRNDDFDPATVSNSGGTIDGLMDPSNVSSAPLLADPANGDFHELTASPTIDRGDPAQIVGTTDLDGEARVQNCLPDIGAYEFAASSSCGTAGGASSGAGTASNAATIGKPRLNRKRGTGRLPVTVPGPGTLTLRGSGVVTERWARATASLSRTVSAAGTVKLLVKAKGRAKRKLDRTGRVKVSVTITFTPTGGTANAQRKRIKLIKKR
jgi:hypothetical protein